MFNKIFSYRLGSDKCQQSDRKTRLREESNTQELFKINYQGMIEKAELNNYITNPQTQITSSKKKKNQKLYHLN